MYVHVFSMEFTTLKNQPYLRCTCSSKTSLKFAVIILNTYILYLKFILCNASGSVVKYQHISQQASFDTQLLGKFSKQCMAICNGGIRIWYTGANWMEIRFFYLVSQLYNRLIETCAALYNLYNYNSRRWFSLPSIFCFYANTVSIDCTTH